MKVKSISRYALVLAFAGTFSFGATQALARPTTTTFRACDSSACIDECWMKGYMWGDCTSVSGLKGDNTCKCSS
jgi:hypothetical protein